MSLGGPDALVVLVWVVLLDKLDSVLSHVWWMMRYYHEQMIHDGSVSTTHGLEGNKGLINRCSPPSQLLGWTLKLDVGESRDKKKPRPLQNTGSTAEHPSRYIGTHAEISCRARLRVGSVAFLGYVTTILDSPTRVFQSVPQLYSWIRRAQYLRISSTLLSTDVTISTHRLRSRRL
jgi:hypothetical protein